MDNIKLYHGDCLEKMRNIDSNSIDMILCDPPYGTTRNKWDSVIPLDKMWDEYKRIIKDNGAIVLFSSEPFTSELILSNLKMFRYDLIWAKTQGSDFLNANRKPLKAHENILVFYKHLPTYNKQYWYSTPYKCTNKKRTHSNNYGTYSTNVGGEGSEDGKRYPLSVLKFNSDRGLHPTQKPVALLEWLIKTYTNENDIVLDNCMGSGSTGVACINTNRKFIGIELDDKYFDIAFNRIQDTQNELIN